MSQGTKVCGLSWVLQERQVSTLAHQNLTEVYTVVLTEVSPKHSPGGLRTSTPSRLHGLKCPTVEMAGGMYIPWTE